jgi:type IV secretory pathway TraG/TraD family ATPase VirD4
MEILQTAITKIVGYGATMFLGAQSLSALFQEPYGIYNQFRDNIRLHVAFASSDSVTQDAISRAIGSFDRERKSVSRSQKFLDWMPSSSSSRSDAQAAIMEPGAVRSLRDEDEIILMRGHPAILAQKINDWRDPILKRRLGPKRVKPAALRPVGGTYPDLPYPARAHPFSGRVMVAPAREELELVVVASAAPVDQTKTAPAAPEAPKRQFKLPPRMSS